MHTILLIAATHSAQPIADALRQDLDCSVALAQNRREALALLRRGDFALLLLDEALATADPDGVNILYANARSAPVLEVNLAISGAPRVLRQARATLARRAHDQAQARTAAAEQWQNEINASLTGILLESQLALRDASPAQRPKLRHLVELASGLRDRLRA